MEFLGADSEKKEEGMISGKFERWMRGELDLGGMISGKFERGMRGELDLGVPKSGRGGYGGRSPLQISRSGFVQNILKITGY